MSLDLKFYTMCTDYGNFVYLTHGVTSLKAIYKLFYYFIMSTCNDKCKIIMATLVYVVILLKRKL